MFDMTKEDILKKSTEEQMTEQQTNPIPIGGPNQVVDKEKKSCPGSTLLCNCRALHECEPQQLDGAISQSLSDAQTQALLNAVVLRNLFLFCKVEDLKQIRQVSRLWNNNSTPELRRRSWITIMIKTNSPKNITKFIDHAKCLSPSNQMKNYNFKHMKLGEENNGTTQLIELMQSFGKYFVKLRLIRCRLDRTGQFWKNLIQKNKWTPNLEEIYLEECCFLETTPSMNLIRSIPSENRIRSLTFHSDKSNFNLPCDLKNIWELFPRLQKLILMDLSDNENQTLLESIISGKLKNPNPTVGIAELDIFSEKEFSVLQLPVLQLRLLTSLKLNLTTLTIDIGEEISATEFQQMMLAYAPRLQKFTIWRGLLASKMDEPGFPFGVTFPVLRSLEVPESVVCNFNFIHKCPQLLYLNLRQCDLNPIPYETDVFSCRYSFAAMTAFVKTPHHVLKELKVEFIVQNRDLEFLRGIFPGLRIFSAFIDRKFVQHNF